MKKKSKSPGPNLSIFDAPLPPSRTPDCASWLKPVLHPKRRRKVIERAVERLRTVEFDAIAIQGYSSSIPGSILAYLLDKELLVIRKTGEERTSYRSIEGYKGSKFVFVDDLISSGNTVRRVLAGAARFEATCVGIYLFCGETGGSEFEGIPYLHGPIDPNEFKSDHD